MIISIVNRSKNIKDPELQRVIRAINQQVASDFEPYWSFGATLRLEGQIGKQPDKTSLPELRGDAVIYVWDDIDVEDALGYHDTNARGIPYAFVFSDLAKQLHENWTVTLSHEVLELIGDAQCNLLVQGPHPEHPALEVFHWFEMCDAVQSQTYKIDDVEVANFLLPLYFTAEEQEGGRNDFLGTLDKHGKTLPSFGVAEGGYIGFYNPRTREHETYTAPDDAKAKRRLKLKGESHAGRGFLRKRSVQVEPREVLHKQVLAGGGLSTRISSAADDRIKHVVVLMLENRSFDQMLGAMVKVKSSIDGIRLSEAPHSNTDTSGTKYEQMPGARYVAPASQDPPHEHESVLDQIGAPTSPMTGFVADFLKKYPKATRAQVTDVMAYFDVDAKDPSKDTLPALHTLARHFAVCDAWHSSVPGPTWQNRFFAHSGTSLGHVEMPSAKEFWKIRMYYQPTVYDAMTDAGVRWKIYYDGIPQSIVMTRLLTRFLTKRGFAPMDDFYTDTKDADSFPEYSFIEPRYFGKIENDQHPPAHVLQGEALIANVYNAIRANPKLWESTLLVVTYDEHGGFYDHVYPPKTVAPDTYTTEWSFDQLGVRVPTILVSPWLDSGVVKTPLEHTSILRYVCEKWSLPPFGKRMQATAGSFQTNTFAAELLKLPAMRTDTPVKLKVTVPKAALTTSHEPPLDGARWALLAYIDSLPSPGGAKEATSRPKAKAGDRGPREPLTFEAAIEKLDALSTTETAARTAAGAHTMTSRTGDIIGGILSVATLAADLLDARTGKKAVKTLKATSKPKKKVTVGVKR
jgi:phospholipase C